MISANLVSIIALSVLFASEQVLGRPVVQRASSSAGDFGSCSIPQIKFGTGFDGRTETAFEPVDQVSYNHGSADNIGVITSFICSALTNTCGADQTAKNTCAQAEAAASAATPALSGAQADAFNAVFGATTDFAAAPVVGNTGKTVSPGVTPVAASAAATDVVSTTASADATATTDDAVDPCATVDDTATTADAASTPAAASTAAASDIGNFGSCSVPQIKFATGFDNRKETSFEPVDQVSYNHGSADNIDIITQFICNTLTNTCGADQTAKNTCAKATAAADTQTAKTGAQADAFNAVFGFNTDFAAVPEVSDQGSTIAGTGATAAAAAPAGAAGATTAAAATDAVTATAAAASAAATTAAASASGSNLQTFTGSLGATAPAVTALASGQFQVDGNSAFQTLQNALERSCDVQNNQCANAANASGNKGGLTVAACNSQQTQCNATA